jgi:hypothetical protein
MATHMGLVVDMDPLVITLLIQRNTIHQETLFIIIDASHQRRKTMHKSGVMYAMLAA